MSYFRWRRDGGVERKAILGEGRGHSARILAGGVGAGAIQRIEIPDGTTRAGLQWAFLPRKCMIGVVRPQNTTQLLFALNIERYGGTAVFLESRYRRIVSLATYEASGTTHCHDSALQRLLEIE